VRSCSIGQAAVTGYLKRRKRRALDGRKLEPAQLEKALYSSPAIPGAKAPKPLPDQDSRALQPHRLDC